MKKILLFLLIISLGPMVNAQTFGGASQNNTPICEWSPFDDDPGGNLPDIIIGDLLPKDIETPPTIPSKLDIDATMKMLSQWQSNFNYETDESNKKNAMININNFKERLSTLKIRYNKEVEIFNQQIQKYNEDAKKHNQAVKAILEKLQ